MGTVVSLEEVRHRTAKALVLADVLISAGATAASLEVLAESGWEAACKIAGFHPSYSPSDATREVVASVLRNREQRPQPVDPFEGF